MTKNEKMEAKRFAKKVAEDKGRLDKVVMTKMVLLETGSNANGFDYVMFEYEGRQYQAYATDHGYTFNEYVVTPEFPHLTEMEKTFLNAMRTNEYQDCLEEGGSGTWTFTVIDNSGFNTGQASGVMASLIKKDLIGCYTVTAKERKAGDEDSVWFTELGKKLFDNADGADCNWGGPKLLKIKEVVNNKEEEKMEQKFMVVNKKNGKPVVSKEDGSVRVFGSQKEAHELIAKMIEVHPTAKYDITPYTETPAEEPKQEAAEAPKEEAKEETTPEPKDSANVQSEPEKKAAKSNTSKSPSRKAQKAQKKALKAKKGEVLLKAFTGMVIGVFPIAKKTKKAITIQTGAGELKFNLSDMKQADAKNPKFANRIELGE